MGEHLKVVSQREKVGNRKSKTSDFFDTNIRTFEAKPPYFCPKKSDVLHLPDSIVLHHPNCYLPSTKKVF